MDWASASVALALSRSAWTNCPAHGIRGVAYRLLGGTDCLRGGAYGICLGFIEGILGILGRLEGGLVRFVLLGCIRLGVCETRLGLATLMWTVPGGAQETGGPYMRDPRHPRHFTDEFKRQIVDLYNAGKPKREIMDEYDLGKSTVERWIKSINATGSPRAADNRTPEQNRILELERENRRLRMEVDVLKQAALIYARK